MPKALPPLQISSSQKTEVERLSRSRTGSGGVALRARMMLLAAEREPNRKIALRFDMKAHPRRRPLPERGISPKARHRRPHRGLRNLGNRQSLHHSQLTETKPKKRTQPPSEKVISRFNRKRFARTVAGSPPTCELSLYPDPCILGEFGCVILEHPDPHGPAAAGPYFGQNARTVYQILHRNI